MGVDLTDEQRNFIGHRPDLPARMLAGPGTGKSHTCVTYMGIIAQTPFLRVRMLTFTRAATKEITAKLREAGLEGKVLPPLTIHSFSLSLLAKIPEADVPRPIRIPDDWESSKLIRPQLAELLSVRGFQTTPTVVSNLEREMGAGWESLDPDKITYAKAHPDQRRAYLGEWKRHRGVYGYLLRTELPSQAMKAVADFEPRDYGVDVLLVDEFQDLNAADIGLMKALSARAVIVIAIGDDDQSIYSWRQAAPHGIREFLSTFGAIKDYPLTISQRCSKNILDLAVGVIGQATDRLKKEELRPRDGAPPGVVGYVRFADGDAEAAGVAEIVSRRIAKGIAPSDIGILIRPRLTTWVKPLRAAFEAQKIPISSTEWVELALADTSFRQVRALALLSVNAGDSLGWWGLMHVSDGIGKTVPLAIYREAKHGETFAATLIRIADSENHDVAPQVAKKLRTFVTDTRERLKQFVTDDVKLGEFGWGGWLLERNGEIGRDAEQLLRLVGSYLVSVNAEAEESTLARFIGQLESVGKDLAASESDGVRVMSLASSKGLTLNTVVVMGVESGIIPFPRSDNDEEERRLLYVALTRATDVCIMTMARKRTGPQAYSGAEKRGKRGPCDFLSGVRDPSDNLGEVLTRLDAL